MIDSQDAAAGGASGCRTPDDNPVIARPGEAFRRQFYPLPTSTPQ